MTDTATLLTAETRPLVNGSALYVLPNPASPLVLLQATVRTGSIHEGKYSGCGVSHFLEHMLFQGCVRYPGNSAADRIHSLGGECNAYTAFDHTAYYAELPAEKLADGLDVLAAMISAPLFPEEKFISEKTVIAREADMIFDRPEQVLVQNLWQQVFTAHPARFPIVGFPDKIAGVSREMMADYYRKRYGAMRTHWLISGPVDPDLAARLLNERLGDYPRGNLAEPVLTPEPEQQFERLFRAEFADPMSRIALGIKTPPAAHRDIPALDLLTGILGQNSSSRLVRKLWQEEELAVALSASGYAAAFAGVMGINASCEPAKLGALENGIRAILEDIRQNGVTAAELEREKLQQRTHFYRTLESSREVLSIANDGIINYGTPEHAGRYLARLETVTLEEVNQAAADYLDPAHFSWSILVPGKSAGKRSGGKNRLPPALPLPEVRKLASGAEMIQLPRSGVPMSDCVAVLPAGAIWEGDRHNGISALLAEMLTSGPADWSESEFYDLLDNHGMELSVNSGNNTLTVGLSYPADAQSLAEKVFARLLRNPRWDANVFAREKSNLLEQLSSRLMNPRFAALQAARNTMFGNHPAALSRYGTPETLTAITLDELQDFYLSRFDPAWVKFGCSASGKAASAHCAKWLEKLDRQLVWRPGSLTKPLPVHPGGAALPGEMPEPVLLDLPREQSTVLYAVPGCTANSPEHWMMEVLEHALNGLSSRLFRTIREDHSLAYSTGASVSFGLAAGMVALYAGTRPERAAEALGHLAAEAAALAENGLSREEFEAARLGAVADCARRLEQTEARLLSVLLARFYGEKAEDGLKNAEKLKKLRYSDFNRALKRCFAHTPQVAVIAGPVVPAGKNAKKTGRPRKNPAEQPELPLYLREQRNNTKKSR